jgi:drug/metabolite transporter (DMT)-like permease
MLSKLELERYFSSEKQIGLIFIVFSLLAIVVACYLFFMQKTDLLKGFAIPVLLLGILFLTQGRTLHGRADGLRVANVQALESKPGDIRDKELPRIRKVLQDIAGYRLLEIGLFAVAALLAFYLKSKKPEWSFWYGLTLSLSIMAICSHGLNFMVKKQARDYAQKVESFVETH